MRTRTFISIALGLMVLVVLAGSLITAILSIPMLREHSIYAVPLAFVIALVLTPILSWKIAPRLRLRNHPDK